MSGISTLNAMFGYNTPIPDAPITRNHRIGVYSSGFKRTDKDEERLKQQQAKPPKDPNKLKDSEKRVLMIVKCNNGVTGIDVSKKTKWTSNHCSMILTALFRKGLIRRVKQTGEGTRWYKYYKKENDTA
jgi:DNA-binding MarR family transcriptional regulator